MYFATLLRRESTYVSYYYLRRDSLTPRKIGARDVVGGRSKHGRRYGGARRLADGWSRVGRALRRRVPLSTRTCSQRRRHRPRRPTAVNTTARQYAQNGVPSVYARVCVPVYHRSTIAAGNEKTVSSFVVRLVSSVVDRITVGIIIATSIYRLACVLILSLTTFFVIIIITYPASLSIKHSSSDSPPPSRPNFDRVPYKFIISVWTLGTRSI